MLVVVLILLKTKVYLLSTFLLNTIFHHLYKKFLIIINLSNSSNSDENLKTLKLLNTLNVSFKLVYTLELNELEEDTPLIKFIREQNNVAFYLKWVYSRFQLSIIKNLSNIFINKEVYIWLDYINEQKDVNHSIIFEIINIIRNVWWFINNDLLRLESAYKKIYILWPKELHLDLCEYCNASCNFCVTNGPWFLTERWDNDNKYKINYTWTQIINLIKKIRISGTESLALWITWEPLLHPEIWFILQELNSIDMRIWFLTNWYNLLENMEYIISNKNIINFYINISCGNITSFNVTRPTDKFINFINTWKAIRIIREKRPDIVIRCLYVITPLNISWICDFIDLCIINNVSEIEFKRVVPYSFSNKEFCFSREDINEIKDILGDNKDKINTFNNNFEYIINEFNDILDWKVVQYPEDENIDQAKLIWKTENCYNPYFYLSIYRNSAFTCGKFEAKIWKLTDLNLFELLFEKNGIDTILKAGNNIKEFLWERKWKEKCSRCHHLDAINIVKDYIKIKWFANLENLNLWK